MIRLLAIDIDGTLLDSRGQLPDAHRDAVVDASARGMEIALVTGRSFHFSRPIADLFPNPLTLIVNNGAVVKSKSGATLIRHVLPRDTARHILGETRAYEDSVALVFDDDTNGAAVAGGDSGRARRDIPQIVYERMDWSVPNRKGYYEKNRAFITLADGPLADALSDDPIQVMFNGNVRPMRELRSFLRALPVANQISVAVTEYERRDFALVDVTRGGCSKGATLAQWVASRGWSPAEVMAAGDNLNDVEMLDFAGTAFVMGNATDALKSRGYRLTESNDEGGLASAIRACLEGDART
jgi:Cof subfamily protein (haloacid dehalogenase superfamily)